MAAIVDAKEGVKPEARGESALGKRAYEKPAFAWEERLEARPGLIQGCAKVAGGDPSCDGALSS